MIAFISKFKKYACLNNKKNANYSEFLLSMCLRQMRPFKFRSATASVRWESLDKILEANSFVKYRKIGRSRRR